MHSLRPYAALAVKHFSAQLYHLVTCCAGVAVLAFSQGPKVAWKAALPSIVGVVGKEGSQASKPAAAATGSKTKAAAKAPIGELAVGFENFLRGSTGARFT